jgi:uncharacterized protein
MPNRSLSALLFAALVVSPAGLHAADWLQNEPSAFLRANAGSPVEWMPWGDEAFARAKSEQKPLYVFVGSFTSELARAMRTQTFANAETSKWLNQQFICVLVDRDERPDLSNLYEAYVVRVKQLSGWPLNIWLTPELLPFDGAAYLAPSEEWGRPGFLKSANQAKSAWATDRAGCRSRAAEVAAQLAPDPPPAAGSWSHDKIRARLLAAAEAWRGSFDTALGGFSTPPKYAEPELQRFLLLQSPADRDDALKTLRALDASAVRDPLDGGFFRYATDAAWRIPYPQKTLSDQARIALAFLEGAHGDDARAFEQAARGALDYSLGRLARPDGTFSASIDATGEAFTGYYAWTKSEIDSALGADAARFDLAHGVQATGNVTADDDPSGVYASKNLLRSSDVVDPEQARAAALLLALRDRRPSPPRDDRATAGAHGLLISALSRAGKQLGDPHYLDAAGRALGAMETSFHLSMDGTLVHLAGSSEPAAPQDYAALALGCQDYARARNDPKADALATYLLGRLNALYYDPVHRAYFDSLAQARPGIFARVLVDGEAPSPESMVVLAAGTSDRGTAIANELLDSLDEGNIQPPGDILLSLAGFAGP